MEKRRIRLDEWVFASITSHNTKPFSCLLDLTSWAVGGWNVNGGDVRQLVHSPERQMTGNSWNRGRMERES